MAFNVISAGDPGLASVIMQNLKHVNYGSALLPVNSTGSGIDNTIDFGSSSYGFKDGYFSSNLTVKGNLTVDTSTLFVDSVNNRVGVETITPSYIFHINPANATDGLVLESSTGTNVTEILAKNTGGSLYFGLDNSAGTRTGESYAGRIVHTGAYSLHLGTNNSIDVTINSSGNVGIGNSSLKSWNASSSVIQLGGNASLMANTTPTVGGGFYVIQNAYNDGTWKYISTDEASYYYQHSGQHDFLVASSGTADTAISWTTAMVIENSGNVGIGNSSLESWAGGYSAIQLGGNGAFMADTSQGVSKNFSVNQNAYYDGNWKYISTDEASHYEQGSGTHSFRVAASGTADTAISWTTAMTIANSGDVTFSCASGDRTITIDNDSHGSNSILAFNAENTSGTNITSSIYLDSDAANLYITAPSSGGIVFQGGSSGGLKFTNDYVDFYEGIMIRSVGDSSRIDSVSHGSSSTTIYIGNQSITTSSDKRLKENIEDSKINAVDLLDKLRIVDFNWNDPSDTSYNNKNARGKWTGVIAQEAIDIIPTMINAPRKEKDLSIDRESEQIWHLDNSAIIPILIKAIQEINRRIG